MFYFLMFNIVMRIIWSVLRVYINVLLVFELFICCNFSLGLFFYVYFGFRSKVV